MYDFFSDLGIYSFNGQSHPTTTYDFVTITGNIASKDGNAYTYSPAIPHAVIQAGTRIFSYDANGNMTHENGVEKFVYNPEGKLIQRGGLSYVYDGDGKRMLELNQGSVTSLWIGNYYEKLNQQSSNTFNEYIYADGVRIAMRKNNHTSYWFHLDHLGGTHLITMANGEFNSRDLYKAWGEQRLSQGNTDTRYFYTGQMREDTNLYYYGARWYDPSLGRFLQADNYINDFQGTQGWDRYAYVNNNPLIFTDINGQWVNVLVGGLIGAAVNFVGYAINNAAAGTEFDWGHAAVAAGVGFAGGALIGSGIGAAAGTTLMTTAGIGLEVGALSNIATNIINKEGFEPVGFVTSSMVEMSSVMVGQTLGPAGKILLSGVDEMAEYYITQKMRGYSIEAYDMLMNGGIGILGGHSALIPELENELLSGLADTIIEIGQNMVSDTLSGSVDSNYQPFGPSPSNVFFGGGPMRQIESFR